MVFAGSVIVVFYEVRRLAWSLLWKEEACLGFTIKPPAMEPSDDTPSALPLQTKCLVIIFSHVGPNPADYL